MIKEWLEEYAPKNQDQAIQALREIMQDTALAALSRSGFFEKAAFYGGTALRVFYNLPRFSEDLDFSLLIPEPDFSLDRFLTAIHTEFAALGMQVSVREKVKTNQNNIESAFLKSETLWRELVLEGVVPQNGLDRIATIKIKIEVDTLPPSGFATDEKLLLKPFSCYVKCFSLPDLFAGKMHAFLFRKWGTNVKGRDWFDMEWYVRRDTPLHLEHLRQRAIDSGDWPRATPLTAEAFRELLHKRINTVDVSRVKADVSRFIPDPKMLDIWSNRYFDDLADRVAIQG